MSGLRPPVHTPGFDDTDSTANALADAPAVHAAGEDWIPATQVVWITLAMLAATLVAALY
jgi:hypothetical protein